MSDKKHFQKKFYFMGNAHLDPVWLWHWQEGSASAKATIRSALDRMNEYPDFKFVCSSASVYRWIEDFDPEMFEEVRQRVKEGRFIVVGGWNVQPDCNIPSGEGFARQSLYSQRYFKEKLGVTAKIGYNVDSFGHNGMMPQILKKSGMDSYLFMRPNEQEKHMPNEAFRWVAPDGSEVLAYRMLHNYNDNFYAKALDTMLQEMDKLEGLCHKDNPELLYPYGVGNHGGGPTKANINNILSVKEMYPEADIRFSDLHDFFDSLRTHMETMPVHTDDLQHHASGCYAAVSRVKNGVRRCETRLIAAETYSMMANRWLGRPVPTEKLAEVWDNVTFTHFHDIMGGCSIESAYKDTDAMLGETLSVAAKIENSALQSLSWKIDTADASRGTPIVVFNPHSFDVTDVVRIGCHAVEQTDPVVTDADGYSLSILSMEDENGQQVPIQYLRPESSATMRRRDTLFVAHVPAMGYATYFAKHTFGAEMENPLTVGEWFLENEHIRVEFDKHTGYVSSILDKDTGREALCGKGAVPVVIDEWEHDTWSHDRNFFTDEIGRFTDAEFRVMETGPVRVTVRVTNRYGSSTLTQDFSLTASDTKLRVDAKIDWHEKHKMLKLAFETAAEAPRAFYEMPFGVIERPVDGEEEPGHMFIAVKGDNAGYALLNNNKYSFSVKEATMYLTAVRSPLYADHGKPRTDCIFTDQGEHDFSYAFTFLKEEGWDAVVREARLFNTPTTYIGENNHKGTMPYSLRGLTCDKPNVIVSAIKRAEDGKGTVIRFYETNGVKTDVTFTGDLLPKSLSVTVTPYSADTYYLPDGGDSWKPVLFTEYDVE